MNSSSSDAASGAGGPSAPVDPLTSLALVSSRLHPDDVPGVIAEAAAELGARELRIYLSDLEQRFLVPLRPPGAEPLGTLDRRDPRRAGLPDPAPGGVLRRGRGPLTFTGRNLTITGIVEPAYEIAGDTFDYAVNGDTAHVAIIDAVGHGLEAARIANLTVVAYRHSRRRELGPVETYRTMDRVVADQFGPEKFATAQLATLTLSTGELRWLNAGHPAPMLIRDGARVDLVSEIGLPIGLATGGAEPRVTVTSLEPGDLVLFFTDGVSEARAVGGEELGRDRLGDLAVQLVGAGQQHPETMRLLGHAVLAHQLGVLQDDATLLLLAWEGPSSPPFSPGAR